MKTNLTIDSGEIHNFTQIASHWWDLNGPFKPLHKLNPLRVKYIYEKCNSELLGKKVLDIGCGGGIVTEALARIGSEVTGIDAGEENIKVAKQHAEKMQLNIEYQFTSIEDFSEQNKKFDLVLALEILEHVADLNLFLEKACKMVEDNGLLIISTINRNAVSFLKAIIAAEYLLNIVPKGTHDHKKFLKPSEVAEIVQANGFKIESVDGMKYDPFNEIFSMTDDCRVNYFLTARKVA